VVSCPGKKYASAAANATRNSSLSLFGCNVQTATPFVHGGKGHLVIAYGAQNFTAFGRVANTVANQGMGIVFTSVEPGDQAILEKWMEQLRSE